jgi:cell division septum initiation protein DivIVA
VDIDFLIDRFEQYLLEESPKYPLSGGRTVNEDEVRNWIAQLRDAIPQEVQRAHTILEQRDELFVEAKAQAQQIIADAEVEAERLTAEHRIVKDAKVKARQIREQAEKDAAALRADADEYVFNALSKLQEELSRSLRVVENGLSKLEVDREARLK